MKRHRKRFDEFSRHEVYDRASIVYELFCSSVMEHPVVAGDKVLLTEAEKASDALYQFYSSAAGKLMPSPATKRRANVRNTRRRLAVGRPVPPKGR